MKEHVALAGLAPYLKLAKGAARAFCRRNLAADPDDVHAQARLLLVQLLEHYNPERGRADVPSELKLERYLACTLKQRLIDWWMDCLHQRHGPGTYMRIRQKLPLRGIVSLGDPDGRLDLARTDPDPPVCLSSLLEAVRKFAGERDWPIVAAILDGTPTAELAGRLGISESGLRWRKIALLDRLREDPRVRQVLHDNLD